MANRFLFLGLKLDEKNKPIIIRVPQIGFRFDPSRGLIILL